MDFRQYLADTEKVFEFRIKTLFPLENEMMDQLEKALMKYRPRSITDPVKTMYQTNPLGFTGVKFGEVFMVDVELTVPVTAELLQFDLRTILGLGKLDENLKVFSLDDPAQKAIDDAAAKEDAEPQALLTQENFEEVEEAAFEDYYGDAYNKKFTEYLKKLEAERKARVKAGPFEPLHPITTNHPELKPNISDTEPKVD